MSYTKETLDGKAIHGSGARERKDGSPIEVEFFGVPVVIEGKVVGAYGIYRDITERKRMEEALRESEERHRKLFEEARDGIFLADGETGVIVDCNYEGAKLVGRDRSELIGLHQMILHPPHQVDEKFSETFQKHLRESEGQVLETQVITSTGEIKEVAIKANLLHIGDRKLLQGMFRDITERKQAEEALRESEEFSSSLMENSPTPILVVNPDTSIKYVNPMLKELTGYTSAEIIGKKAPYPWWTADPESGDVSEWKKDIRTVVRGREKLFRKNNGEQCWVEITSTPITRNGEFKYALTNWVEFTERKRAEEALRQSERGFRRLVEHATDAFFLHDFDGSIMDVNQHACESSGYTREELLGLSIEDIDQDFVPGKHLEKWGQMVPGVPITFEGVHRRKDGTTFPVEVRLGVLESGERQLMLGLVRDISERKRAEEEKQNLVAQLVRAQKMEAIGTLAGGVAHDLNNILSGLVSYPELLLLDLPKDSPLRQPILTIQNSGQKATAIVQNLLTLARRGVAATEVENLNSIVSNYLISPEFGKLREFHPNVKLETDFETDLLPILGSPVHLSKTVMNLVSNAAEAMPHGGEIFISTENRYIDQPIRGYDRVEEGDYVTLIVSDTGVGIPQKDIEKIFEPFYTKKVMGRSGTGLGMAVVWGTVKDHKGYIDVKSTEGKGTTFTLYFPVTRKESAKDESRLSIEDYRGTGESILVVDDVKEQREIAGQVLKRLGYSVTSVSSGEEAVDYMKDNSADLLLLDMIMDPGIDGLETYKRILELRPGQKAIIVSGFSETERVREVQRLGAGAYVKKPYLLEKIGLAVRDELER